MHDFREIGAAPAQLGAVGRRRRAGHRQPPHARADLAASTLVKRGAIFDLGIPFDASGPQPGGGRINPVRLMSETGAQQAFPGAFHYADDYVFMPLQSASQWDGLAHVFYDDQLYNGFPSSDVGPKGAMHCSIDKMAKGIVGRGVLLDIARLKGVDWLGAGLRDHAGRPRCGGRAAGRHGRCRRHPPVPHRVAHEAGTREKDALAFMSGEPGLGLDCCEWLARPRRRRRGVRQLGDRGARPARSTASCSPCTWCSSATWG